MNAFWKRPFSISPSEASFAARGFAAPDRDLSRKLEIALESFIAGYNMALQTADTAELAKRLSERFDTQNVGFAFEGVGLWLTMRDLLVPGNSTRLADFLNGAGRHHDYIVAVGSGFAIARVPWGLRSLNRYVEKLDPFLAWCIPNGYGFHEGFFHHRRYIEAAQEPPEALSPLGRQLFDSGVGRAMWWVKCAQPDRIKSAIDRFAKTRRAELWSGIGIAAAYAGGVGPEVLKNLLELSGPYQADFLSGLPFAARLRQKAGNYSEVTEMACQVLMHSSTDEVADMAEASAAAVRTEVRGRGITNAYDLVRQDLVNSFRARVGVS